MALSREDKEATVADLVERLESSKMTVVSEYTGLGVSDMQNLRAQATEGNTSVRVAKNRLMKLALSKVDNLKDVDTSALNGQLVYVFNNEDEVAPAQILARFAKDHPSLEFVGAISENGDFLDAEEVKHLASLPSKDQLRGQLVGTIGAPVSGFVNVLAGNLRGLMNTLNARAQQLES